MAISLSTGLVNDLAGKGKNFLILGSNISFTEGTKRISSGSNAFLNSTPGDKLQVLGSLGNNVTFTVSAVDPAGAFVTTVETPTTESSGSTIAIANFSGGKSLKEILQFGTIAIFPSTVARPANADAAEGGSPIVWITKDAGVFTPGSQVNGLELEDASNGVITKSSDEWSGTPTASGTALWARYYDNDAVQGASATARRMDMSCGFASGEMQLSSTSIESGKKVIVTTGQLSIPKT